MRQHWISTEKGRIFTQCWSPLDANGPPIILLHDSLGCLALWRDFPGRLAVATGRRVIAYDRLGFGQSGASVESLPLTFIEDEAEGAFRALYTQLGLGEFVIMGHSVGGGMAVSCAATYPDACKGLITESAQAFVEPQTLAGIQEAKAQFAKPGQLERLQKYHGEKAKWVLRYWTETWLSAAFREWNLDGVLAKVCCPMLAIHGELDEYGSALHPQRICAGSRGESRLLMLPECGHVPHREHQSTVLDAIRSFLV